MIETFNIGDVLIATRDFHININGDIIVIFKDVKYDIKFISKDFSTFSVKNERGTEHYFDEKYLNGINKLFETLVANRKNKINSLELW